MEKTPTRNGEDGRFEFSNLRTIGLKGDCANSGAQTFGHAGAISGRNGRAETARALIWGHLVW